LLQGRFAGLPDFFAWPLPGPVKRDERVPGFCSRFRPELDEVPYLQAVPPQQADHVAVAEMAVSVVINTPVRRRTIKERAGRYGNGSVSRLVGAQVHLTSNQEFLVSRERGTLTFGYGAPTMGYAIDCEGGGSAARS